MQEPTETMCCRPELAKFEENDPDNPINWTERKKTSVVAIVCLLACVGTFATSVYAAGQTYLIAKYNISIDLAASGISFNILGAGTGPLICPLSEVRGRKYPYMIAWPLAIALAVPSAFVDNFTVILLFRFFTGCCTGNALNNGAGYISDMYHDNPSARVKAVSWLSFSSLCGPILGSFTGFLVSSYGWPGFWALRVHFFLCIACWPLVFMLPESYGPTILQRRARALRAKGNIHAFSHEELEHAKLEDIIQKHLFRPVKMLMYEPICQGSALWIGLAFGISFFFLEAYPIVFIKQHNVPFRFCGAIFLFILAGVFIALALHQRISDLLFGLPLPGIVPKGQRLDEAESRLKVVIPACFAMPISLLWLGWTSGPETHWVAPALSGVLFGYSMMSIFICFFAYLTQIYTIYSSSASAANTFVRATFAAVLPMISHSVIKATGTKWGLSIFAFLSFGLLPIPLIFIRYGKQLRTRSHYAQAARQVIVRMNVCEIEEIPGLGILGAQGKNIEDLNKEDVETINEVTVTVRSVRVSLYDLEIPKGSLEVIENVAPQVGRLTFNE